MGRVATFTVNDVQEIRRLSRDAGLSNKEIAAAWGVSDTAVRNALAATYVARVDRGDWQQLAEFRGDQLTKAAHRIGQLKAELAEARTAQKPVRIGGTYFILRGDKVKIGHARDIQQRFNQLAAGQCDTIIANPHVEPVLLGINTNYNLEAAAHLCWKHLRREGEWFEYTPELRRWIAEVTEPLEVAEAEDEELEDDEDEF